MSHSPIRGIGVCEREAETSESDGVFELFSRTLSQSRVRETVDARPPAPEGFVRAEETRGVPMSLESMIAEAVGHIPNVAVARGYVPKQAPLASVKEGLGEHGE